MFSNQEMQSRTLHRIVMILKETTIEIFPWLKCKMQCFIVDLVLITLYLPKI